jgi:3-oxoacyl-[acyl-carrier-protein] synthase I
MGIFDKNPAPAKTSSSPSKPTPKSAAGPVAITGVGVACHAGDQPYALISSVLGQMSGVQLSEDYKMRTADGSYAIPRMAPVEELTEETDRDRMYTLNTYALKGILDTLPASISPESLLVVIIVDPELITRYNKLDPQHLQSHLTEQYTGLTKATFRILPNDKGSGSSALRTAIAEMNQGKWQAVLFGGADSLISMDVCLKLDEAKRLNTTASREGLIPGEAAAFILLQTTDAAKKNPSPALAYLKGLGNAVEPNARDADLEATEGLSTAISQAVTQAGIQASDIQGIVHNLGAETIQSIEWYQTTQKLWPRRVNEQQRLAVQLGELKQADIPDDPIPETVCPYQTMGEVGAGALPIQIATAIAWIAYDAHQSKWGFPIRNHLLVCDTPEAKERGALIISPHLTNTSNQAARPNS